MSEKKNLLLESLRKLFLIILGNGSDKAAERYAHDLLKAKSVAFPVPSEPAAVIIEVFSKINGFKAEKISDELFDIPGEEQIKISIFMDPLNDSS